MHLSFCRTVPFAIWSRAPGIWGRYRMTAECLIPARSQKFSPAVTAQHFLSSYCALSKYFSLHTSFTTCHRDFTKPVHTLYTKKRRKRTGRAWGAGGGGRRGEAYLPSVALLTGKLTRHNVVKDSNQLNKWSFSSCSHM